ncbi:MAG: transketolase [Armatimonadetes bacterium]|nr:transketolase [Armatimonadota bacterium]MCX7967814.1 transketolase [Armatimonadota bacterium]MDW8142793.1 transketolase [Armatimonadota bacterium]
MAEVMERQKLVEALKAMGQLLRRHAVETTTLAGSGHPTTCLSASDIVATLFFTSFRYDVSNPENPLNDRFVLSKGHAAPLLYAVWAEAGAFPVEHLKTLRRIDSELEGHPTPRFKWAEVATGSLGQGLSIANGMALAAKMDNLPYRVYALLGDGEVAEGGVWEAIAFASYYKLDNLTAIVDVNRLGQSAPTMLQHDLETYARRFEAFGWHSIIVDGHDVEQLMDAFEKAKNVKGKPTVILAKTIKGKGVSFLEDKEGWHGRPLPKDLAEKALAELALTDEQIALARSLKVRSPEGAVAFAANPQPPVADPEFPRYELGQQVATREAYGDGLVALGKVNPNIVALDGDVKNSTFSEKFMAAFPDRFVECFIAEQNMIGTAVGLATRGKIPFASSFACFLMRAYDFIRMAGIGMANIKLCGSHAGVSIGEDGPSQMGLEDIAAMRAIPGSVVLYPCDAVSTVKLVAEMAKYRGIAYLRTTRPKTPVIYSNEEEFPIGGCKVLRSSPNDVATIVAAGITVFEALKAYDVLANEGIKIRIIDLYSVKPIDETTLIRCALETNRTIITVEDHYPEGGIGDAVAAAVSKEGIKVHKLAVNDLPRSGKPEELMDMFGISARHIVETVKKLSC